jgi:hypothetical protein
MGVPAREDAMDAMVPCEVRAAANVNETPWGVALPDVDRSETSAESNHALHHLASLDESERGILGLEIGDLSGSQGKQSEALRRHDFVTHCVY